MAERGRPRGRRWRIALWGAAALILLLALIVTQLTGEASWKTSDLVFLGALLGSMGLGFELAVRVSSNPAYRATAGAALAIAFLLFWINAAVGVIGSAREDASLLYSGVLAVALIGTGVARLRPAGMAWVTSAAALAQALVPAIAWIAVPRCASLRPVAEGPGAHRLPRRDVAHLGLAVPEGGRLTGLRSGYIGSILVIKRTADERAIPAAGSPTGGPGPGPGHGREEAILSDAFLLEAALKSFVVAGGTLIALRAMPRGSVSERNFVGLAGIVALLMLPLLQVMLLDRSMGTLNSLTHLIPAPPISTLPVFDPGPVLRLAYVVVALVLGVRLIAGLARLQRLTARARPVTTGPWAEAYRRLSRHLPAARRARLLVSDEIDAPLSWGLLRPVVLIDPGALADPAAAPAVLAHELAHLERRDWAALMMGRVAAILFWFNPLAWILVRNREEAAEQAADDFALGRVDSVAYAEILLAVARRTLRPPHVPAQSIVGGRGELTRRLTAVLDEGRRRRVAGPSWAVGAGVGTFSLAAIGAAAHPLIGLWFATLVMVSAAALNGALAPRTRSASIGSKRRPGVPGGRSS